MAASIALKCSGVFGCVHTTCVLLIHWAWVAGAGETAHPPEPSSAVQEQHVDGHLHHPAMGAEESSRLHNAEHRHMRHHLQDGKETDVPQQAVTRSQLAALRRRELLDDDDDSGTTSLCEVQETVSRTRLCS